MSGTLGYRICLNMLCACPDFKNPEQLRLNINWPDFGSGVFDVNTIRSAFESSNQVQNNVMYDDSGLKVEDIFPEIIDTRVDTQGHPLAEHILIGGRAYPVEFIQNYLRGGEWRISNHYKEWLEKEQPIEGA